MLPCSGFIPEEQLQLYHCRCRLQIKNGAVLDLQCDTVLYVLCVLYVCARARARVCVCACEQAVELNATAMRNFLVYLPVHLYCSRHKERCWHNSP